MAKKKSSSSKSSDTKTTSKSDKNELTMFDKASQTIFSLLDKDYADRAILNAKDKKFRSILNRELEISKGVSNGSVVDFISSIRVQSDTNKNGQNNTPDTNELFTKNINDIFGYFQDMYRNKFIEISDLKFISKFIPALGEAVRTTLDSIVASDNIAESVNLKIELPTSISDVDRTAIINEIKRNESELKLRPKLKNVVFKKTLVTGTHYVYAVSYNKIFEEFDKINKKKDKTIVTQQASQFGTNPKTRGATEAYMAGDVDLSPAMESIAKTFSSEKGMNRSNVKNALDACMENISSIECNHSDVYSDAMESVMELANSPIAMEALKTKSKRQQKVNDFQMRNSSEILDELNTMNLGAPDGVKDINDKRGGRPSKFNISGTYIKFLDCKNVIPVKVFDQKIGYYIIHPKPKKNANSAGEVSGINSIGNTLFSAVNVGEEKKHDAVSKIANTIAEGIMQNFSEKFVTKNVEFKKLIADCVIANGLVDQDYNIQFISANDIIEFTVNENENGDGESMLTDSLFPAKLLLSTIVCRLLNYINKTGNKTIAHVHKGPIGSFTSNQINRVIRDLQEQNVTFNDLLSPNLVFNKFNRDGNIQIPTAKDGTRLVEFETQEGQQVDMSPEYEKELENMAILGTGVPTVIMEYAGSADFAKQLVSANIKFAGRVGTLQGDLEESTTELYKEICRNSNLTDEQKELCESSLRIVLPRPRVLTNSNNSDYVQTLATTAELLASAKIGQDSASNPEILKNGTVIKERLMYSIMKDSAPFIDWEDIDEKFEKIMIEYSTPDKPEEDNAGGGF